MSLGMFGKQRRIYPRPVALLAPPTRSAQDYGAGFVAAEEVYGALRSTQPIRCSRGRSGNERFRLPLSRRRRPAHLKAGQSYGEARGMLLRIT